MWFGLLLTVAATVPGTAAVGAADDTLTGARRGWLEPWVLRGASILSEQTALEALNLTVAQRRFIEREVSARQSLSAEETKRLRNVPGFARRVSLVVQRLYDQMPDAQAKRLREIALRAAGFSLYFEEDYWRSLGASKAEFKRIREFALRRSPYDRGALVLPKSPPRNSDSATISNYWTERRNRELQYWSQTYLNLLVVHRDLREVARPEIYARHERARGFPITSRLYAKFGSLAAAVHTLVLDPAVLTELGAPAEVVRSTESLVQIRESAPGFTTTMMQHQAERRLALVSEAIRRKLWQKAAAGQGDAAILTPEGIAAASLTIEQANRIEIALMRARGAELKRSSGAVKRPVRLPTTLRPLLSAEQWRRWMVFSSPAPSVRTVQR